MSTSLDGVGNCPPNTYNLLQKFSPRVLLVARGILAMVVMESAVGSYLYELAVSVSVPGYSAPPPVKMKLPIVAVGIYASPFVSGRRVFFSTHAAGPGVNS